MRLHILSLLIISMGLHAGVRADEAPGDAAADAPESRLKAAAAEMKGGWSDVRAAFRREDATNAERSKAVDSFFTKVGEIVRRDGDTVVSGLLDKVRAQQTEQAEEQKKKEVPPAAEIANRLKGWLNQKSGEFDAKLGEKPETPPEAREGLAQLTTTLTGFIDDVTSKYGAQFDEHRLAAAEKKTEDEDIVGKAEEILGQVRDHRLLPRAELTVRLVRDIIKLEEQRVFDLIAKHNTLGSKIDAAAAISKDMVFLSRQARALARMVTRIADVVGEIVEDQKQHSGREVFGQESRQHLAASLDKFYPTLIETADDLGIYYAKVVQSASGLIFHVNREAYEKLDYLQGKFPRAMSFEQVRATVEEDLGRPLEVAFSSFEREPRANGSIAQVHFATTHATATTPSTTVAVKVLKANAPAELAWNQRTNDLLFKYAEALAPEEVRSIVRFFTEQARELGRGFMGEMDLGAERWRQDLFRKILKPIDSVSIPATFPDLSGPRVLTSVAVLDAKRIHEPFNVDTWIKSPEERVGAEDAKPTDKKPAFSLKIFRKSEPEVAGAPAAGEVDEVTRAPVRYEIAKTLAETGAADELSIGELFLEFNEKYGFTIKPRYFQVLRSAVPFVSVNVHLGRTLKRLTDQGRTKEDPEVKALTSMMQGSIASFMAQLFYIKELHADFNWGNLLVDPQYKVHLIDWGSTVQTQGLILQPLLLVGAVLKGDARQVLKRLDQVGGFTDLTRDREALLARIQTYLDQEGLEKRSYPGLVRDMWKQKRAKKREALEAEQALARTRAELAEKMKAEVNPGAATPAETPEPDVAPAPAPAAPESPTPTAEESAVTDDSPEVAAAPAETAPSLEKKKPKAGELLASGFKVSWLLAKTMAKYPYHRTRVRLIRAAHGAPPSCSKYLVDP